MATLKEKDAFVDMIVDWISNHMNPEDVFDDRELDDWAARNNYVVEEE